MLVSAGTQRNIHGGIFLAVAVGAEPVQNRTPTVDTKIVVGADVGEQLVAEDAIQML